jgi:hypothetical protein
VILYILQYASFGVVKDISCRIQNNNMKKARNLFTVQFRRGNWCTAAKNMKFGVQENHKYLYKFIRSPRPTYIVTANSAIYWFMTDGLCSNKDKSINTVMITYMKDNSLQMILICWFEIWIQNFHRIEVLHVYIESRSKITTSFSLPYFCLLFYNFCQP